MRRASVGIAAGLVLISTLGVCSAQTATKEPLVTQAPAGKWAIVLHGGAGVIQRSAMTAERDKAYRAGMQEAVNAAAAVLDANGSAVDAVEAALNRLEDNPLFNCGKGAVFTADGKNTLDAAIMDGKTMMAGAVADVTRTKNPISLAKAVMEKSPHVMLAGDGADQFAASVGLTQVDPSYFFTEARWQGLVRQLKREGKPIPPRPAGAPPEPTKPIAQLETPDAHKWGTTGIVVRDRQGNIAAGTTTGGIQGKRWGRVGDSPIIGAGTYASNQSCGVSATGTVSTSFASPSPGRSARWCSTRACGCRLLPTRSFKTNYQRCKTTGRERRWRRHCDDTGRTDRLEFQLAGNVSSAAG